MEFLQICLEKNSHLSARVKDISFMGETLTDVNSLSVVCVVTPASNLASHIIEA